MGDEYINKLSQIKKDIGLIQDSIFFELNNLNIKLLAAKEKIKKMREALEFYADPENWERENSIRYDTILSSDCADYPHFTRDVRLTGGHKAREVLKEIK